VTYGVTFNGSLDSPSVLRFKLPHASYNNDTTAFMELDIENAHGIRGVDTPNYPSSFDGTTLKWDNVQIGRAVDVLVETHTPIKSVGICRVIGNDVSWRWRWSRTSSWSRKPTRRSNRLPCPPK
jgi:hypothetical protein